MIKYRKYTETGYIESLDKPKTGNFDVIEYEFNEDKTEVIFEEIIESFESL